MRVLLLSLALLLPGCTLFQPADIPVSQSLSPQAAAAQKAINEANVALAATANVIVENVASGILTKPETQSYVAKLRDFASKVDAAQVLLNGGKVIDAKNQAELLKSLIIALHRE